MKKRLFLIIILLLPVLVLAKSTTNEKDYGNVVFFAYFNGDNEGKDYLINNYKTIIDYYEGDKETYVTNYLENVSYNNFHLHNLFPQVSSEAFTPIELSISEEDANKTNLDYTIIREVLQKYPSLSKELLDYDNDGIIDNLTVILKNNNTEACDNSSLISHKGDYPGTGSKDYNNLFIGTYNMLNTDSIEVSQNGVIIHEFLHSLGYPDLYNSTGDYPVYLWDIMGAVSKYPSYPLAYLRSYFTNWLSIDTITESTSLTLNLQSNKEGNQAYIIKSPLNDYELFVVEYRKKKTTDYINPTLDTIDRNIINGGIIVYRVNTSITGLSNHYGNTGIYVFREIPNDITSLMASPLSLESGRVTLGNSDLNSTEHALTFSDGTNSGIVIKNVSSNAGEAITFDVEVPSQSSFDLWQDTNFTDNSNLDSTYTIYKQTSLAIYDDILYKVSNAEGQIYTSYLTNEGWNNFTSNLETLNNSTILSLITYQDNLYLIASGKTSNINLYKLNNNTWEYITSIVGDYNDVDAAIYDNKIYFNLIQTDDYGYGTGVLYAFDGRDVSKVTNYTTDTKQYYGNPKLAVLNNNLYIFNFDLNANLNMYKFDGTNVSAITTNIKTNSFAVKTLNNQIYIAVGATSGNNLTLYTYDTNFTRITTTLEDSSPNLVTSQGNLYLLSSISNNDASAVKIYLYDVNNKVFIQEGETVDSASGNEPISLVSNASKIYVATKKSTNNQIVIKYKETVNKLLSLSITSPNKTTYLKGEAIDLTGLKVIANYTKETKELDSSLYVVTDFATTSVGSFNAKVAYEGVSNTFNYEVIEKEINIPLTSISLYKSEFSLKVGASTNLVVSYNPSNTTDSKDITWLSSDSSIVNVAGGKVTAISAGTATITASVGTKETTCIVTVTNDEPKQYEEDKKEDSPSTDDKSEEKEETLTLAQIVTSVGYKVSSNYSSGYTPNTSVSDLNAKFNNLVVISSTNTIGTGTKLKYNNEELTVVIYGDLNGDGEINSADLLKMRKYLLGTSDLTGEFKEAAMFVDNGTINSANLLRLRQHLLGTNLINK